jgi:predicted HAD superfamily Cof-like phosphohydrolase
MRTAHQQRIEEFMRKAGQEIPARPIMPSLEVRRLRANLILEEALETIKGLGFAVEATMPDGELECVEAFTPDIVEVVDGCGDLSVVTIGTLSAFGVKDEPILEAIDASNLQKFGPGSYRRESDGKWMKPPDHKAPDIMGLLIKQKHESDRPKPRTTRGENLLEGLH